MVLICISPILLSIFSFEYLPFVLLCLWNVSSKFLPIFQLISHYWAIRVLHIFQIQAFCQIYVLHIYISCQWLALFFLMLSSRVGSFNFDIQSASVSANSVSTHSTNSRWKIFLKIPESSKKQNLNLLGTGNYLHSFYIVFTIIYIAFTLYLQLFT